MSHDFYVILRLIASQTMASQAMASGQGGSQGGDMEKVFQLVHHESRRLLQHRLPGICG